MATQPRNKAAQADNKSSEDVVVYELKSPSGDIYKTTSRAEFNQLHRAHGYEVVKPKDAAEPTTPAEAPASV